MNKHAYLIIAHNQLNFLKKIICELDCLTNDIYVLIDKKSSMNFNDFIGITHNSKLKLLSNTNIYWGGFSQINAELTILKSAYNEKYSYYHLISGSDFPVKSNEYIYNFFENSNKTEFLEVTSVDNELMKERVLYHYFLQDTNNTFLATLNKILVKLQKILKIKRNRPNHYFKGANWFSITHDFATYVLENEDFIKKEFKNTLCCDEIFLQTLLMNSKFKENLVSQEFKFPNKRYVVWDEIHIKSPKYLDLEDYANIMNSECIFARKFHEEYSFDLINKIIVEKDKTNE